MVTREDHELPSSMDTENLYLCKAIHPEEEWNADSRASAQDRDYIENQQEKYKHGTKGTLIPYTANYSRERWYWEKADLFALGHREKPGFIKGNCNIKNLPNDRGSAETLWVWGPEKVHGLSSLNTSIAQKEARFQVQ